MRRVEHLCIYQDSRDPCDCKYFDRNHSEQEWKEAREKDKCPCCGKGEMKEGCLSYEG